MNPTQEASAELAKWDARCMYYVPNPFKQQRDFIDKNGVLCWMTWEQYFEECSKPKNRFTRTPLESAMYPICMGLGFLMICFIIGMA